MFLYICVVCLCLCVCTYVCGVFVFVCMYVCVWCVCMCVCRGVDSGGGGGSMHPPRFKVGGMVCTIIPSGFSDEKKLSAGNRD